MLIKLHSLVCYLSMNHGALHVVFAFVWAKRQSQGHGSGFANWNLASGVQTFSCMDGDQEESSEEGIKWHSDHQEATTWPFLITNWPGLERKVQNVEFTKGL